MPRETGTEGDGVPVSRRTVLSIGAGALAAGLGIGGLTGDALAWNRFDVHFESRHEVWMLVADDLEYDPPAVAHVIVDTGDGVACRLVEFTEDEATTVVGRYGETSGQFTVVPYRDDEETVLGVLSYNRPTDGGGRFSRPRCVMRNDRLDWATETASVEDAGCVQAAMDDHWDGDLQECWFEPVEESEEGVPIEFIETYAIGDRASAEDVIETDDGGFALAGWRDAGESGSDALLVKTDAEGNEQFRQTYGGDGIDQALSLVRTADGGYALAGLTTTVGAGGYDAWLLKTDDAGTLEFERTYGGTDRDRAKSIVQTDAGGFALAGDTKSVGPGVSNFWLLAVDGSGTVLGEWTYGGSLSETCRGVVRTGDGGFALAGTTLSFGGQNNDCWVVKTDGNGSEEFNATFGGDGFEIANDVVETDDGGLALAGTTTSFGPSGDCWLVRTDETGSEVFSETYGGDESEGADALVRAEDGGGFALAGYTDSFGDDSRDALLVKAGADGTEEYVQPIDLGVGNDERARAMIRTSDGGYALAGETIDPGSGGESLGGTDGQERRREVLLVKTG